jgi:ArsR family transcriptional regulator
MNTLASTANLLQLFGEPTRVRLMALLVERELTVAELTSITDLGQSTVSTHLAKLRDAGVLRDRRAGASTFYTAHDGAMPADAKRIWETVRQGLKDRQLESDSDRCDAVLRAREKEAAWPDPLAGEMERHYSPGRTWESLARGLFGLVRLGDVLDAGSGDGSIAQLVVPRAKSVTCLDRSERMIEAARARLRGHANARFCVGDAEDLPFEKSSFDQVLLFNVLAHVESPARAIAEAARVLRKRGTLAVITLGEHDHADATAAYNHKHPGFSPAHLRRLLRKAHLEVDECDVTSREKRPPYFPVVTAFATKG